MFLSKNYVDKSYNYVKLGLENNLQAAIQTKVSDNLRISYTTLGDFHFATGDMTTAIHYYEKATASTTTQSNMLNLLIKRLEAQVCLMLKNIVMAQNTTTKNKQDMSRLVKEIEIQLGLFKKNSKDLMFIEDTEKSFTNLSFIVQFVHKDIKGATARFWNMIVKHVGQEYDEYAVNMCLIGSLCTLYTMERQQIEERLDCLKEQYISPRNESHINILRSWLNADITGLLKYMNKLDKSSNFLLVTEGKEFMTNLKLKYQKVYLSAFSSISFDTCRVIFDCNEVELSERSDIFKRSGFKFDAESKHAVRDDIPIRIKLEASFEETEEMLKKMKAHILNKNLGPEYEKNDNYVCNLSK